MLLQQPALPASAKPKLAYQLLKPGLLARGALDMAKQFAVSHNFRIAGEAGVKKAKGSEPGFEALLPCPFGRVFMRERRLRSSPFRCWPPNSRPCSHCRACEYRFRP